MILNLTQHKASREQLEVGVVDLENEDQDLLRSLLTFDEIPHSEYLMDTCCGILELVKKYNPNKVMIGGFPPLMTVLETALCIEGIEPLYAFSKRMVREDGEGKKVYFKHIGFTKSYVWDNKDGNK